MEKKQQETGAIHISENPSPKKKRKKQTPEEMIRELQGIFSRGRYQSWVSYQVRKRK